MRPTIFLVLSGFQPPNSTHDHAAILYKLMILTTPTHQGAVNSHSSWLTIARLDGEKSITARNGGPTRQEDCFLSPFVQRPSQTWPWYFGCTHPPRPVSPSLLEQSLSPKDIGGSVTSLMKVSCWIYPATSTRVLTLGGGGGGGGVSNFVASVKLASISLYQCLQYMFFGEHISETQRYHMHLHWQTCPLLHIPLQCLNMLLKVQAGAWDTEREEITLKYIHTSSCEAAVRI